MHIHIHTQIQSHRDIHIVAPIQRHTYMQTDTSSLTRGPRGKRERERGRERKRERRKERGRARGAFGFQGPKPGQLPLLW